MLTVLLQRTRVVVSLNTKTTSKRVSLASPYNLYALEYCNTTTSITSVVIKASLSEYCSLTSTTSTTWVRDSHGATRTTVVRSTAFLNFSDGGGGMKCGLLLRVLVARRSESLSK